MKRWIIRGFFVGALLLCVGGWAESYARTAEVAFMESGLWTLQGGGGQIGLEYWPAYREKYGWRAGEPRWRSLVRASSENVFDDSDYTARADFLRFFLVWNDPYQPGRCAGGIPFWFPTTLSAALLWLVWRKTRPKVKGRAFPVEVTAKEKQP